MAELVDYAEFVHAEVLSALAGMTVVRSGNPDRTLNVNTFGENGLANALAANSIPAIVVELLEDLVSDHAEDMAPDDSFSHHRTRVRVTVVSEASEVRGQIVRKTKIAIHAAGNLATSRAKPRFVSTHYGQTQGGEESYLAAEMVFEIQFHSDLSYPEITQ